MFMLDDFFLYINVCIIKSVLYLCVNISAFTSLYMLPVKSTQRASSEVNIQTLCRKHGGMLVIAVLFHFLNTFIVQQSEKIILQIKRILASHSYYRHVIDIHIFSIYAGDFNVYGFYHILFTGKSCKFHYFIVILHIEFSCWHSVGFDQCDIHLLKWVEFWM